MKSSDDLRHVSVVIPVYNNSGTLIELQARISESVSEIEGVEFEIIYVNDGSSDSSNEILSNFVGINNPNHSCTVIELEGNFGQLGALFAGYESCNGEAIITMSADLQDPPEIIKNLVIDWQQGNDLVIGIRSQRTDSLISRLTSRFAYWVISSKHKEIPRGGFDVYLMTKEILSYLLRMNGRFRFIPTDLMRIKPQTSYVGYHRAARKHGVSGYSLVDRWQIFLTAMIDTSYRWIQIFSLVGVFFAAAGMVLMASLIYGYINNSTPFQGFTLITCLILVSAGLQILILSLIGEYMWRTYDMARNKPLYILKSIKKPGHMK